MAGDAVREALLAAEQALYDLPMRDGDAFAGVVLRSDYCLADNLPENLQITRAILRQVSAAAISAFLRALPDGIDLMACDCGAPDMEKLAAAVSRAGGDGDG